MKPRGFRILALTLALALHVAVFVPWWLTADTLRGGAGGPVSPSRSMTVQLAEVPPQPEHKPQPQPRPEPETEPDPEPDALKTEKKEAEKPEKEQKQQKEARKTPEEAKKDTPEQKTEPTPASKTSGDGREAGPGAHRSGTDNDAWNQYLGELQRAIEQHKTYPRRARLRRIEGVVRVRFELTAHAGIDRIRVEASSGSPILDRHVQRLLRRITLPAPPEGLEVAGRNITVPVQFRLR